MDIAEEAYYVRIGIETYGGSFMNGLAQAIVHADLPNLRKIKETWPEAWEEYKVLGIDLKTEKEEKHQTF